MRLDACMPGEAVEWLREKMEYRCLGGKGLERVGGSGRVGVQRNGHCHWFCGGWGGRRMGAGKEYIKEASDQHGWVNGSQG